jgi:hypothetical protein
VAPAVSVFSRRLNQERFANVDTTPKRYQKTHPDAYPTSLTSDQNGLPIAQEATEKPPAPDIQANGPTASNGQANGPTLPRANVAKPEADPFDVKSLRLSQDFESAVGVKKLVKTVPVKKPSKEWFVRTHPDPAYRLQTAVLELKEDRETYLVAPGLWTELVSEPTFSPRLLVTSITRQGVLFVWPIRIPGSDGRTDEWSKSALAAADEAKTQWVRVTSNMHLGAYDVAVASGQVANPSWPDITFQEIIKIAFRDKMISDWDHPVLRRLRGED